MSSGEWLGKGTRLIDKCSRKAAIGKLNSSPHIHCKRLFYFLIRCRGVHSSTSE